MVCEDFCLVSAYGASPNSKIFYSRMKGEGRRIKKLHFNKITISNLECSIEKTTDRTGEVLGARIISKICPTNLVIV